MLLFETWRWCARRPVIGAGRRLFSWAAATAQFDALNALLQALPTTTDVDALRTGHNRAGLALLARGDTTAAAFHLSQAASLTHALAANGAAHDSFVDVGGLLNDRAVKQTNINGS